MKSENVHYYMFLQFNADLTGVDFKMYFENKFYSSFLSFCMQQD